MAEMIRVLVPDSRSSETLQIAIGYAKAICEETGIFVVILLRTRSSSWIIPASPIFSATRWFGHSRRALWGWAPNQSARRDHADVTMAASQVCLDRLLRRYGILDLADGTRNVAGVVAVPDLPGEANDWAKRWGVIVHGEGPEAASPLIEDEVVVRALEMLTRMVNLSTGLGHPRDKAFANEVLRILRAKGHANPTPHIRSWAIRNGWKPEHAVKLEALSRKIWELKGKPSLSGFHNPHERYERWRSGEV